MNQQIELKNKCHMSPFLTIKVSFGELLKQLGGKYHLPENF